MEEEKNQIDQNFAKINLNPFTTQEMLDKQMEQFLNQEEIQLTIQKRNDCNILLENILQKLKNLKILKILKLILQNFRDIDFDSLFSCISQISSICELNIRLVKDIQQFKHVSHNVGHYLSQLENLQILNLQINLKRLQFTELTFNLYETYQKCSKLRKLDFTIENCNTKINIFDQLLDGIRFVENLEELSINIFGDLVINYFFNKLCQEIKNLKNIKSLEIFKNWRYGIQFQQFQNLLDSLSKIQSIVNIKLNIALNSKEEEKNEDQYNYLKKIMSQFQSLKKFDFNLSYCNNINIVKILESIAQLPNVEETTIELYINNTMLFENDLSDFSNALQCLQSLVSLDIFFSSIIEIELDELINLIGQIKNLKKLKNLTLNSKLERKFQIYQKLNLEDFKETIKKLEKLDFSISNSQNFIKIENEILNLLQNSQFLKELRLQFDSNNNQDGNLKDQLVLKDILHNKKYLERIRFLFNKSHPINQEDIISFFQSFQTNQQIKYIEFFFPKEMEYDFLFLDSLSQGLSYLTNLTHLFLDFNRIDQSFDDAGLLQLSSTIGKIVNMQLLQFILQCDYLQSSTLKHIIQQFKNMVNLKSFVLEIQTKLLNKDNNDLQKIYDAFELPKGIQTMSIFLDDGDLNFYKIKNIFLNLQNLNHLYSLNLRLGKFLMNQSEWIKVRSYLNQFKSIQRISLQLYDLQSIYLVYLFDDLPYLKKLELKDYDYQNNYNRTNIRRKFAHKFDEIYQNKIATYNGFQKNQISEYIVFQNLNLFLQQNQEILWSFQSLQILTHFDLNISQNPNIDENFICGLLENMKSMNKLVQLNLDVEQNSKFGYQSLIKFGEILPYLAELKCLKIQIKQLINLKQLNGRNFLQGIKQLKGLQDLKILIRSGHQNFQIFDFLNESFEESNYLKSLSIDINILEGDFLEVTPKLQKLFIILRDQLKHLSLRCIQFSSSQFKTFSKYLKILKNLTYIEIYQNPKQDIYKLPRLVTLQGL
ncbi:hypothetical protein ABPG74_009844 [Tetrahymena malaccensis]